MTRKTSRKKRRKQRGLALGIVVVILLGGFIVLHFWDQNQGVFPEDETDPLAFEQDDQLMIRYNNVWYTPRDNVETILLIGLDKFEDEILNNAYNNNLQADFLLLGVIDHDDKSVSAIQINRDTIAEVPVLSVNGATIDSKLEQIALAFTYGSGRHDSCRNTCNATSALLYDVTIDHYAAVTMDAVKIVNDAVGGVEVEITEDMSAIDPSMTVGSSILLTGEQALKYVRSRRDLADSTNIRRMERQRQYLHALTVKCIARLQADDNFLINTSAKVTDYVVTDFSAFQMNSLTSIIEKYRFNSIFTIQGESVEGEIYMEFYPDEDALKQLIVSLLFTPAEP